uniref:Alpha-catulin n=1 Tax=Gongylonema pulchrum TaxID=637853 RepID=A0A183E8C0_9BILA
LNGCLTDDSGATIDKSVLVRAARQLLTSVTRVLLLADRIAYSLVKLENTTNFTDFVKIFTEFGGDMVDLAHRSGDRQNDLKSEKRRGQMAVARTMLERLTMLLLTSNKTLLRHPDSESARQCRNGVFQQVSYCLILSEVTFSKQRRFIEMLEMVRVTYNVGTGARERLISALDSLCEMTQDFTDSAYTPHHHREQILDFLEECRFEMTNLIQPDVADEPLRNESIEVSVERLGRRLKDLRKQLQIVAMEQISEVLRANEDQLILSSIKACSVSGDIDGVEKFLEKFREHAEHMQEVSCSFCFFSSLFLVCRLLHHVSLTDGLHVATGHVERNLRALAPLTLLAGRTLCIHPSSRIARENLEVFCDTWAQCINDLSRLAKETDAAASGRLAAEKQAYMSLPRPGVSCWSVTASQKSDYASSPLSTKSSSPTSEHSSDLSSSKCGTSCHSQPDVQPVSGNGIPMKQLGERSSEQRPEHTTDLSSGIATRASATDAKSQYRLSAILGDLEMEMSKMHLANHLSSAEH